MVKKTLLILICCVAILFTANGVSTVHAEGVNTDSRDLPTIPFED